MPQNSLGSNPAINPDGVNKPLNVDADGNLLIVAPSGGLQITPSYAYETVAADQTDQVLGATGATGDLLASITYVPATTEAGIVQIQDGANSAITLFVGGGTTALVDLRPVTIPLNIRSVAGAWSVTTGANVSVIAAGQFT